MDAKEVARRKVFLKCWVNLDLSIKTQIKNVFLQIISSTIPNASCTCLQVLVKISDVFI